MLLLSFSDPCLTVQSELLLLHGISFSDPCLTAQSELLLLQGRDIAMAFGGLGVTFVVGKGNKNASCI